MQITEVKFKLEPCDNSRLAILCGEVNANLHQVEDDLKVKITNRGNSFHITGGETDVEVARKVMLLLYKESGSAESLLPDMVHLVLQQVKSEARVINKSKNLPLSIKTASATVQLRNLNQRQYISNILTSEINFGIGPAGTGKTFLAVASAVAALEQHKVRKIVLVRPAVETGERLGFLPGDLAQKIDPYLRPLYDALYEMLGFEKVSNLLGQQIIEIAPLAYMRGRTLSDAFIILDEGQNTTVEQMQMFLTRVGFGSITVVTGDITQIDLPIGKLSGLKHAMKVLADIKDIKFNYFESKDVVRHSLVQKIIDAYGKAKKD